MKNIVTLVRSEFARLTSSKMATISLLALMIVPVIYGGLYLWGNKDPYNNLGGVPAAIVVADDGATVDGKKVNYGADAAKELLDSGTFGFKEVSASEAEAGVANGTYDFSIGFPATFSSDLASAADPEPTPARLKLVTSDTNSYLSTTLATKAAEEVRVSVAKEVGDKAAKALLDGVSDLRDGLVDAKKGAAKLADGSSTLADGALTLKTGTAKLATGASDLSSGLATLDAGAAALPASASKLNDGAQQVADGASSASAGATNLSTGAKTLSSGAKSLASGASAATAGAKQLATGANALTTPTGQAAQLAPAVRAQLVAAFAASDIPQATQDEILGEMTSLNALTAGIDAGANELSDGASDLSSGLGKLTTGANQLSTGATKLSTGAKSLASGTSTLASGAAQVADGTQTLASKAPALASGAHAAATGASTLSDGAADAASGATKLSTGADKIEAGATKLTNKLSDGIEDVKATTATQRAEAATDISDPVDVAATALTKAQNYGAGLAPFFLSLSSWIGIYALFLLVRPLSRRALSTGRRPIRTMLAGWATPAALGAVQMIALFALVAFVLNLQIALPVGLLFFMMFTAIVYAAIVLALNALLGSVGQFLGLVLMVIQLVTAGGTFPWQTLPGPLATLHRILPMSHAVDGMRYLIYGGDLSGLGAAVTPMLLWLVGSLLVATYAASKQGKFRTLRELRPSPIGS